MWSLHPALAQQRQVHPMSKPPLPITSAHHSVAPHSRRPAPMSNPGPSSSISSVSWTPLGPASLNNNGFNAVSADQTSGRITGIAVDPTNDLIIYVAAAGGGVWKTTDGGQTWAPLTDGQANLAMGSIAVAHTNHLRIYAGTGEANNSADSRYGSGILVSSDGGSTWALATAGGAFAGVAIGQIAVDPTNADIAYAAVGGLAYNGNQNVNEGIWKTTDGGGTWTNMTAAASLPDSVDWMAVVVDPNTPTTIYAAVGTFYGGDYNGVYRSTDSGGTWSLLTNAPNGSDGNLGRIALAVSPAAKTAGAHVLYVTSANTTNHGLGYFLRSDNADAAAPTFTDLTSTTPDFLGGGNGNGQGWYDIAINVDTNGNVYCAGVENYADSTRAIITSSNLGVNWTDLTVVNSFQPHTDNHAIAFDSSNNMIVGNDGGIFRYNPVSPGWTDLNGNLNTIQFQGIGLHPTDIGTVVGGSQDNGTELYSNNLIWDQVRSGDGGPAKISQTDGSICYHEYNGVSIERSSDGCHTWNSIYSGISAGADYWDNSSDFYAPYALDPTNGDHLLFGADYVNESINGGSSWSAIGTPGVNGFNGADHDVDSIALSPANGSNPQVVYATTGGWFSSASDIFVTNNGGSTWTIVDLPPCSQNGSAGLGCRVNQIIADPNDPTGNTAIAVTSTFSGSPSTHVYRTTNMGGTWTSITGNLPDLPTWSVVVDTDPAKTMYVSNDSAVYSSASPYGAWTKVGVGLPNVQGSDLELNTTLGVLALGSHGRGAWEIYTKPHVTNISTTVAAGSYVQGNTIPIVVTFSAPVTVTGTPHLTLNTLPATTISYASGSTTNSLTFNYTIGAGQRTLGNLDATSLSLNGGAIVDGSGTSALLGLYQPGGAGSLSSHTAIIVAGPPFGWVDRAIDAWTRSTTVGLSDSLLVSGWAVDPHDGAPVTSVNILIDGNPAGSATVGQVRPDVAAAYGNPAYQNSGWSFTYAVSSLSVGPHTVTAVASDSASLSATLRTLNFNVAATSTGPPFGWVDQAIDARTRSTTVAQSDSLLITGWAVDPQTGAPVSSVRILIDGNLIDTAALGVARPDVAAVYGKLATLSGWTFTYGARNLTIGTHTLSAVAYDSLNLSATLRTLTFTVAATSTGAPFGWVDQAVDATTKSTTVSRSDSLLVSGWAFDPQDGAPVSSVNILIDGNPVGTATLAQSRPDVAAVYGSSASLSGWSFTYAASLLTTGTHTVTAVASDSLSLSATFEPITITVQ
jgi:lysozyme family protein